jgi:hypothetical protein
MSYESEMLKKFKMPPRRDVERVLLHTLFKHNGIIRDFSSGEATVAEIANYFELDKRQRDAYLETTYRKENRRKRTNLWHRLLFRAADELAKSGLVARPTETLKLTGSREWMLTEKGFDRELKLRNIPSAEKRLLAIKSFEVEKIAKKLTEKSRPEEYNPFDKEKNIVATTKIGLLRLRGFRQAVIEAYEYKCAFCGMKMSSPDFSLWEVEAAHIVPHYLKGKDDVLNGVALCRLHHWAFDVGWLTLLNDYSIQVSKKIDHIASELGKVGDYDFIRIFCEGKSRMLLPKRKEIYPHPAAMAWHRENRFNQ